jgi:hypothetical protein
VLEVAAEWSPQLVLIEATQNASQLASVVAVLRRRHACTCALVMDPGSGHLITVAQSCDDAAVIPVPLDPIDLRRMFTARGTTAAGVGRAHPSSTWVPPCCSNSAMRHLI